MSSSETEILNDRVLRVSRRKKEIFIVKQCQKMSSSLILSHFLKLKTKNGSNKHF